MSLKAKIEAVLFLTAKPIKAQAMARIVNADVQAVRQALLELVHDYEERQGGLEISVEDGYSFQVKDEYANLMDEFLPVEMSAALIRTLSAIAIKQPIAQSEIIRVRGAGAYDHIRELVNRDLVLKKEGEGGRSPMLSTTKKFQEYFRLTKDGKELRNYLKGQVKKAAAAEAAAAAGQLSIPDVMENPEADNELNNRIFLETADMSDVGDETMEPAALVGEAESQPVVETIAAGEFLAVEAISVEPPAEAARPETQVVDIPPPPQVEEPAVPAANTLSKLAAAATAKDPEPLPAPAEEAQSKEQTDAAASQAAQSAKSSVQAHMAKDGPATGVSKKKKRTSGLSELLKKQKDLEMALKLAQDDSVEQTLIEFPAISEPNPSADKNLPS